MKVATALYVAVMIAAAFLAAALFLFVQDTARVVTDRAIERAVQIRTQSTRAEFARTLHEDWRGLSFLAERISMGRPDEMRLRLEGLVGTGHRVSWAGYAGLDGRIIAASGGLLEGADVSARPWFQAGLRSGFAGDVHDALMLNALLGGDEEDPIRFIDLAVPVTGSNDQTIGVVGLHISFGWAETFLAELAAGREMEFVLANSAGDVIFSTSEEMPDPSSLRIFRAAAAGVATNTREVWPDGEEYIASLLPQVTYADLPDFGWRLVGRVAGDAFDADRRDLVMKLWALIAGVGLTFFAAAAVVSIIFLRPLSRLVDSTAQIADGKDVYPEEARSSAEAKSLSESLALIQSRLHANRQRDFSDRS
jgi:hypothetical protein